MRELRVEVVESLSSGGEELQGVETSGEINAMPVAGGVDTLFV